MICFPTSYVGKISIAVSSSQLTYKIYEIKHSENNRFQMAFSYFSMFASYEFQRDEKKKPQPAIQSGSEWINEL